MRPVCCPRLGVLFCEADVGAVLGGYKCTEYPPGKRIDKGEWKGKRKRKREGRVVGRGGERRMETRRLGERTPCDTDHDRPPVFSASHSHLLGEELDAEPFRFILPGASALMCLDSTPGKRRRSLTRWQRPDRCPSLFLVDPYTVISQWLGSKALGCVDCTCRTLLKLNVPAWRVLGERSYFGMELEVAGAFVPFAASSVACSWKSRCELFHRELAMFSEPYGCKEICSVEHQDEVAYFRCRLRTDLLADRARGVYVEVDVNTNADNLSLAVVDFEGGGRSSVTFSPETGAVLRERKVRESPRAIEGAS